MGRCTFCFGRSGPQVQLIHVVADLPISIANGSSDRACSFTAMGSIDKSYT